MRAYAPHWSHQTLPPLLCAAISLLNRNERTGPDPDKFDQI